MGVQCRHVHKISRQNSTQSCDKIKKMKRMEIGSGKHRKTGLKLIGGVIESCLFVNRKKCVVF